MGEGADHRVGGRWFESEVEQLFFSGGECAGPSESADGGGRRSLPVWTWGARTPASFFFFPYPPYHHILVCEIVLQARGRVAQSELWR